MGRAYGPRDWAMVVAFGVIGMLYVTFKPEGKQAHKDVIIEQFGLPEDVTFDSFRSGFGRHSPGGVEAIIQFTPAQYLDFYDSVRDDTEWTLAPYTLGEMEVTAQPDAGALKWHDADWAVITPEPHQAVRWADWGHGNRREVEGKTSVWDVERRKTFCYGVNGQGAEQRIAPCTALVDDGRPDMYVRALLDRDGKRLFVRMRT